MRSLRLSIFALTFSALAAAGPPASPERCAQRLAVALTGHGANAALMSSADPQAKTGELLTSPEFREHFARFINAQFNSNPGTTAEEDAPYFAAKYVLEKNLPWRDVFIGRISVDSSAPPKVVSDPNGLGYFHSKGWMKRYAGNEEHGIKLMAAYRIMQNTVGLTLKPAATPPGTDAQASGRQAAGCRFCHYDNWFALDHIATVLGTAQRTGSYINFQPYDGPPVPLLDGRQIADDRALVEALTQGDQFDFNTCRLAFRFLYGRAEYTCEAAQFDACVDAFRLSGSMQSALAAIAQRPEYCQ